MSLLNMIPTRHDLTRWDEFSPFFDLHRDLNRLADDMTRTFKFTAIEPFNGSAEFMPKVDIKDEKELLVVTAELPGLTEKDVEVSLTDDSLTIKGEKKAEKEEKKKDYYRMERSYGSFERVIPLPYEVETNKVEASFKNGVLTIHVPKTVKAQTQAKKISIKAS